MKRLGAALIILLWACGSPSEPEQQVPVNYTTPRALDVLGTDTYLGLTGGLYPGGRNEMPTSHAAEAQRRLKLIVPRDAQGNASASGAVVLLSIGYSNATQEYCNGGLNSCAAESFTGQATRDAAVNHTTLRIANGAAGGQTADTWDAPTDTNYARVKSQVLAPMGLTEAQVQVVWLKVAHASPRVSLPDPNADAYALEVDVGEVLRALHARYPNLQLVFAASRTYAGFATTALNPEPYAFEGGFAVKWAIEAQAQPGTANGARAGNVGYDVAPWIGWGPYLWAGGAADPTTAWVRADFANDGTHPSASGVQKVGRLLLDFFKTSPLSQCWFLAGRSCA